MRIYGGSGGIASPFSTSALDGSEWLASRPCRFTPGGKRQPGTHWTGSWVGPRVGLDAVEKRFLHCRESNREAVQIVARCYTNWAIPAPKRWRTITHKRNSGILELGHRFRPYTLYTWVNWCCLLGRRGRLDGGRFRKFSWTPPLFGRVTDPTGPVTSAQHCHNYTCFLQQAFHSFVV
jgi:hypothetical protein